VPREQGIDSAEQLRWRLCHHFAEGENMKAKLFGAMAFAAIAVTSQAGTPNTTATGAVSYEVGQGWVTHGIDESSQNRWFAFKEVGTRSYCVEAALGTATYLPLDPNLTLYSDSSGTTVYLTNTDGASEPPQNKGSRVCYISPTAFGSTFVRLIKVNVPIVASSGDSGFVRLRVVETTQVAETYFVQYSNGTLYADSQYNVYNQTNTSITARLYLVGFGLTPTFTVPAQGVKSGGSLASYINGGSNQIFRGLVYLMGDGPPGALFGWVAPNSGTYYFSPK